jgi:hypothetical protein
MNANKYLLVFMSLLVLGCSTKQKQVSVRFSGDHTTAQIRGMWNICFQTRMKNMPYFPAPLHFQHCDCLIDTSRENFSSQEYDRMGKDNLTEFFRGASIVCSGSATVPNEPIEL